MSGCYYSHCSLASKKTSTIELHKIVFAKYLSIEVNFFFTVTVGAFRSSAHCEISRYIGVRVGWGRRWSCVSVVAPRPPGRRGCKPGGIVSIVCGNQTLCTVGVFVGHSPMGFIGVIPFQAPRLQMKTNVCI